MPGYKCKIAARDGTVVEKVVQADTAGSAKQIIARDGGFPINIEKLTRGLEIPRGFRTHRLKPKDFFSFNNEFLALLRAGIPVVAAFDGIIKDRGDTRFTKVLQQIRQEVSDGESVSNAFEKQGAYFSPLYVAALRAGEAGGNIPDAIEQYLVHFERSREIRQKLKAASVYPAVLTVCAISVVSFLLVFVVPAITGTFVESNADLPFFTRLLLGFSDSVRTFFWEISAVTGMLILGWAWFLNTAYGRRIIDFWWLKMPVAGNLTTIYTTALFASSLSSILSGGTPLTRALYISHGLIQNTHMRSRTRLAIEAVEDGEGFARALTLAGVFPDMALRMIAAGEHSGSLEKVLADLARFYEKEVGARLNLITSVIEPALMVLMGFVIGFIMLAMYMPIFQMAGTIG